MAPRASATTFILLVLLLDSLGAGLIIPVLPRILERFTGGDPTQVTGYYGVFVTIYAAVQFVFGPILGGLSDRFGRRLVILASLFGAALDYALLVFAPTIEWLFIGRVISGIAGASFTAATAYVADVTPPQKRAQSFGLMGAAFGVGFIVGPALGGLLGDFDARAPFILASVLNGLNLLFGLLVLPESLQPEHRRPFSLARANPFGALRRLAASPLLFGLAGTFVSAFMAQHMLEALWALYTQNVFAWTPLEIGLSLTLAGVAVGVVQAVLVRLAVGTLGERRTVLVGLLASMSAFLGFGLATQGWVLYALIFPFALGGLVSPSVQALLTREVSESEQGELQGALSSLRGLTAIVAPMLGTALFARFGTRGQTPYLPGVPFLACAALTALGLLLAWRLFARLPEPAAAPQPAEPAGPLPS